MTFYKRIARIDYESGVEEPWKTADRLNSRLSSTDYSVLWFIHGDNYLVENVEFGEDDFDVEVLGSFDEVGGDMLEATDKVSKELQGNQSDGGEYRVAEFPNDDRLLVWVYK